MRKIAVQVELTCEVPDDVDDDDICLQMDVEQMKLYDFYAREREFGKVLGFYTVGVEQIK